MVAPAWAPVSMAAEDPSLGEVTIRAEPLEEQAPGQDRTVFSTVIDTSEKTGEADSLADVLAESVGVQVRRLGGLGAFSTLSIRGSNPGQVQFYIDGMPISRAQNEVVNLSDLPLDSVERIEVYRSFVPIAFSRAGPGGAVNIVTKSPGPEPRTGVSSSYGSFETRKVSAERSQRLGRWEYLLFGTYTGSKGNFDFRNDNGTPSDVNPYDDFTDTRRNNAFNAVDLLGKGAVRLSEGAVLTLTDQAFWKDGGVPGLDTTQALDTSLEDFRNLTQLRGDFSEVGVRNLDVRTTAHLIYDRSQFDDPKGEIGGVFRDTNDRTFAAGADTLFTYYWGRYQVPGLLLASGYEEYNPSDRIFPAGAGPDQDRVLVTVAAQDEIYLWNERVVFVPAVRWEWLRDDFTGAVPPPVAGTEPPRARTNDYTSPRLGMQLRVLPALTVLGNIGRLFRPPNFTELFGARGVVVGRSDLDAEKAFNSDIGFRYWQERIGSLDELRVEYAYFDNDVDDLIVLVPVSLSVLRPENISAARIRGHEFVLYLRAMEHFALTANYTHQLATDESSGSTDGNRLPGRAENEAYLRTELYAERARVYFDVSLIGDNFRDQFENDRVPARQLYGLGVSVTPFDRKLTMTFEVKNLTDDRTRDFAGFPLPGRSFFGTVQYGF